MPLKSELMNMHTIARRMIAAMKLEARAKGYVISRFKLCKGYFPASDGSYIMVGVVGGFDRVTFRFSGED